MAVRGALKNLGIMLPFFADKQALRELQKFDVSTHDLLAW